MFSGENVLSFKRLEFLNTRLSKSENSFKMPPLCAIRRSISKGRPILNSTRRITEGCMIEYLSPKGSKRVAIVNQREGAHVKVMNDAKKVFSIPLSRLTYHIDGKYAFGDLLRLDELLLDLKLSMVEKVWEELYDEFSNDNDNDNNDDVEEEEVSFGISDISERVWGVSSSPIHEFATTRLMGMFGTVFFIYQPLSPAVVQDNMKDRAALRDFKNRFIRASAANNNRRSPMPAVITDLPDRVLRVLDGYEEGLRQLMTSGHPWVNSGWARKVFDEEQLAKGRELLELLDLSPSPKNARKVLEMLGRWTVHGNLEKVVMGVRDVFPDDVLEEGQYIMDNCDVIPDPDERIRLDLRHLGVYAIDTEGANEVDDAVSIETLEDGREKVWVHISDVSRWIRPGSKLSLEAERRMSSVYMPDEKISMFPDVLSAELLSLGARMDSYALSCGMVMGDEGDVISYELCPSKIRITRRMSYSQLDALLQKNMSLSVLNPNLNSMGSVEQVIYSENNNNNNGKDSNSDSDSETDKDLLFDSDVEGDLSRVIRDLSRLNTIAQIRHKYRIRQGALDHILRHKTELYLSVRKDPKNPNNCFVNGYTSWSNGTSVSMVAEYMILMSETLGHWCQRVQAPVWYKVQKTDPPLEFEDLFLRHGEVPFVRAARVMKHLRAANDSRVPGLHCTSGAEAYVQVTSPIRRYMDLYNHYRIKAAMHGASLGEGWSYRAEEEAGIQLLDRMATSEDRMSTLNAIRLVTRQREQYWMEIYVDKLIASNATFDCLVYGPMSPPYDYPTSTATSTATTGGDYDAGGVSGSVSGSGSMYEALILQLGSYYRHRLYSPSNRDSGDIVKCRLFRRNVNLHAAAATSSQASYLLLPVGLPLSSLPEDIVAMIQDNNRGLGGRNSSSASSSGSGNNIVLNGVEYSEDTPE
eukprot:gene11008-22997_t